MTLDHRRTGWLDKDFCQAFREILLHSLVRYEACCPIYCLMSDHLHLMLVGWSLTADQLLLVRFLRKYLNEKLSAHGYKLQKQAHDHVLESGELHPQEFENAVRYIALNPVKAGIVADVEQYEWTGTMLPGYPVLSLWSDSYWRIFWDQISFRMEKAQASWNAPR